jgi:hypothetical protein
MLGMTDQTYWMSGTRFDKDAYILLVAFYVQYESSVSAPYKLCFHIRKVVNADYKCVSLLKLKRTLLLTFRIRISYSGLEFENKNDTGLPVKTNLVTESCGTATSGWT